MHGQACLTMHSQKGTERLERFECIQRERSDHDLQYLESGLEHCAQKIIDVRLARIKLEHSYAALDAEIDFTHPGDG